MEHFGISDVGNLRDKNEDNYIDGLKMGNVVVSGVADGMGGHYGGDVASELAVDAIKKVISTFDSWKAESPDFDELTRAVETAVDQANTDILAYKEQHPQYLEMGTTVTVGAFANNRGAIAHVGDSRAYIINNEQEILQLTADHSLVNQLYQEGKISSEKAENHPQKNILTRALGTYFDVSIDVQTINLPQNSVVLFATDGLTDNLSETEILQFIIQECSFQEACQRMVDLSKQRGGHDNITVTIVANNNISGLLKR